MFTIDATVDVINVVEGFSFSDVAVYARGYEFNLREGQVSAGQLIDEDITAWGFDLGLATHGELAMGATSMSFDFDVSAGNVKRADEEDDASPMVYMGPGEFSASVLGNLTVEAEAGDTPIVLNIVNAEFNYNKCTKYAAKVDLVQLQIGDADAGGFAAVGKGSVGCLDEKTGDRRFNFEMGLAAPWEPVEGPPGRQPERHLAEGCTVIISCVDDVERLVLAELARKRKEHP